MSTDAALLPLEIRSLPKRPYQHLTMVDREMKGWLKSRAKKLGVSTSELAYRMFQAVKEAEERQVAHAAARSAGQDLRVGDRRERAAVDPAA